MENTARYIITGLVEYDVMPSVGLAASESIAYPGFPVLDALIPSRVPGAHAIAPFWAVAR